ncbi:DivIVA domain-containing protein (plasmid) [Streptomyces sp. AHU1]|uniref:DivIVA domain-containing protein n=1 Tax=Streptomyces sp. AHU1 TaxID=3377215 RepID=UPI003877DAF8
MNATDNFRGSGELPVRPVTPDELRSATFSRAPLTRRGFAEDEVRLAIRRAADALGMQLEDNRRLRAELQRQRDWIRAHNVGGGATSTGVPGVDTVLQVVRDQQAADRTIAYAREQAKALVQTARAQAQALVEQSKKEAARLVAEASGPKGSPFDEADVTRLVTLVKHAARQLAAEAEAFPTSEVEAVRPIV